LPLKVEFKIVPEYAPPPSIAVFAVNTQLETIALGLSQNTPPPSRSKYEKKEDRVAPCVRVKPTKAAPLVR
jgi:hypothetical protein